MMKRFKRLLLLGFLITVFFGLMDVKALQGYSCVAGDDFNRADTDSFASDNNWTETDDDNSPDWAIANGQLVYTTNGADGDDNDLLFDPTYEFSTGVHEMFFSINCTTKFHTDGDNILVNFQDTSTDIITGGLDIVNANLFSTYSGAWYTIQGAYSANTVYNISMECDFDNNQCAYYVNDAYVANYSFRTGGDPDNFWFNGNTYGTGTECYIDDLCLGRLASASVEPATNQTPNPINDLVNTSQGQTWVYIDSNNSCNDKCILYQDSVNVVNFSTFPYQRTGLSNNTAYNFYVTLYNESFTTPESNRTNDINITTNQFIANSAPSTGIPILNATDHPNNETTANITGYDNNLVDDDGDLVVGHYRFYQNGKTWAQRWIIDPDLVLYLPFDNASNEDYSGHHTDTAGDVFTGAPDRIQGSGHFDTTQEYLEFGDGMQFSNTHTILGWFYFAYGNPDRNYDLVNKYDTHSDGFRSFSLFKQNTSRRLYYAQYPNSNTIWIAHSQTCGWDCWMHVAVTANDTDINIYLNDVWMKNATFDSWADLSTVGFTVGGSSGLEDWHNGYMDEVMVYNRTLTRSELSQIYNATLYGYMRVNSSDTDQSDEWVMQVTPYDNNTNAGTPRNSTTLIIASVTPPANQTPTPLQDLVNTSQSYTWVVLDSNDTCEEKCLMFTDGVNNWNFSGFPYNATSLSQNTSYSFYWRNYNSNYTNATSNNSNTVTTMTLQEPIAGWWNNSDHIVWLMGDTQIRNRTKGASQAEENQEAIMNLSLMDAENLYFRPDAMVQSGDFTTFVDGNHNVGNYTKRIFNYYNSWFDGSFIDSSTAFASGNHDYYSTASWTKSEFSYFYSDCNNYDVFNYTIGNVIFYTLCHNETSDPDNQNQYPLAQLDWHLDQLINETVNIFIVTHYKYDHTINVASLSTMSNRNDFTRLLHEHNTTISGHVFGHEHPRWTEHTTEYHNTTLNITFIMNAMFAGNGAVNTIDYFGSSQYLSFEEGNRTALLVKRNHCDDPDNDQVCENQSWVYNANYKLPLKFDFDSTYTILGTPSDRTPLIDPVIQCAENGTSHVYLTWTETPQATYYTFYNYTAWLFNTSDATETYNVTNLNNNTQYNFSLQVVNHSYTIALSNMSNMVICLTDQCIVLWQNNTPTSWINQTVCNTTDEQIQNRTYTRDDANSCSLYLSNHTERQEATCNYCSNSVVFGSWTAWSNATNNCGNRTRTSNDTNWAGCCLATNITADCYLNDTSAGNFSYTHVQTTACTTTSSTASSDDTNTAVILFIFLAYVFNYVIIYRKNPLIGSILFLALSFMNFQVDFGYVVVPWTIMLMTFVLVFYELLPKGKDKVPFKFS